MTTSDTPQQQKVLQMWTVYHSPEGSPGQYVARKWEINATCYFQVNGHHHTASTLEEIREFMPAGLIRIPRQAEDDPVIIETWL
jgi:hypothetical protein